MRPIFPIEHMFFGRADRLGHSADVGACRLCEMLRSVVDKKVFDLIDPVAERYRNDQPTAQLPVSRSLEDESPGASDPCRNFAAGPGFFSVRAALERRRMEHAHDTSFDADLAWASNMWTCR